MYRLDERETDKEIYLSEKSAVFRGNRFGQPVIIKTLRSEYPDPALISEFKQEYEILQKLQGQGLIRAISLEKFKSSLAIIFEDIGGEDLSKLLAYKKFSLVECLEIMLATTKALGKIHSANIVHRDIKAHNIVLNEKTRDLQIIDFGSASFLIKQNSFIPMNSSLEGTLSYISPEQTGRMNRTVDYRTDYYSLGVTFYQILTGELPFVYTDPMELVHAHIAKTPVSPFNKNGTPKILSDIIMKLLEKNPEDRYQSANGLIYDLELCISNLDALLSNPENIEDRIENINNGLQIGQKDFSTKFQIPEKLYGRAKEIIQILKSFKHVTEGEVELVLISGRSGIGKSVLINELNKPILEYKGYFASGKFDQFKRTIPYYAITRAFQNLLKQILTEKEESILKWKHDLQEAVGANGQIIVEVIPELETLIGRQPPVSELGLAESKNRFNLVFQNFIKAFCQEEHAIAIFLDDLQWADTPSIYLVESILTNPEMKFLLLILSFRDNEVLPTDAFSLMLEDLKKKGIDSKNINLEPLSLNDVNHLVSDTLHLEKKHTKELAQILHTKTKGNPFFVNAMFKSLYDKDLIYYKEGIWAWDISKIEQGKITENVIDLLIEKVKDLNFLQAEILKLAACIGDSFSIEVFFLVSGKQQESIANELTSISNEGFLIVTKNIITFVHDKIREATYTLINNEERAKNHFLIGKTYLSLTKAEDIDDLVFTIVSQLNQGIVYITEDLERKQLLELNVLAGNKSLASSAYDAALSFYTMAVSLLSENSWKTDYKKTLDLYIAKAQAEYLSTNFEMAEKTFELIMHHAERNLDKISVYELKSSLYTKQLRMREALTLATDALKLLKVSIPKHPSELSAIPEIIKAKIQIGRKNASDFLDLPLMVNETDSAIMRLLNISIAPSYLSKPLLFPVLVMKMVNLSLRRGISPISPFAFIVFGMIQGSALGDFKTGYEWGKLAINLVDKYNFKSVQCRTLMVYACAVHHWTNHARTGNEFLLRSIQSGIENGDLEYTSYSLIHISFQALAMRKPLKEVLEIFEKMRPTFLKIKQDHAYFTAAIVEQTAINLKEVSQKIHQLKGVAFDEDTYVHIWIETNNSSALHCYYTMKCVIGYFFEEPEVVEAYSRKAVKHEKSNLGTMFGPEILFFDSLNLSRLYNAATIKSKKKEYKKRIAKNAKKMKAWAVSCEANYGHKFNILQGLIREIEGNDSLALKEYKTAIYLAKKHEYILEEAIANELSAAIWRKTQDEQYEQIHLIEAHYCYRRWGSEPMVKKLEDQFPFLKRKYNTAQSELMVTHSKTLSTGNFLDLNTVVKASQTLSGEIQFGRLLEKMMKILFENAGAERGFFILKETDNLFIEAEGKADSNYIEVLKAKSVQVATEISVSIVNYVARTKNLVLLNDATKSGMFTNDSYVKANTPKSILCYPILNQGHLVGIVYLENNLTTDAFTPDRVEILKVLSSQIAVSVENSLLYTSLEAKVMERTRDLNEALVEVRSLKEQQDGDYFLNTLLIEPLAQNNAQSSNVEIEFFIKQKKQFIFRNGYYELGGDINISENLELQKNKYIVFLNGDAMGKSIQGAGGVLVLGTVFKSIIQRTQSTDYGKTVYPEKWLKDAFIEMHKAFVSFDGSMLMSLVFGLIDERTGVMYFLNAEHPDMALYRDGKASFIENTTPYTKLGTQGQAGSISIQVFSLLPGDIVISGSDGRDDIIIGKEENSEYDIINEDHDLFLHHVEHAEGDLHKIYEMIAATGKLMDDISLCKVYFKGYPLNEAKVSLEATLKSLSQYKIDCNYAKFLELAHRLIADYPHLTNYLYEISNVYKEIKQYDKAITVAERARLRYPKNFNNLLVLLESYIHVGKTEKVRITIDTCLSLKPNDERLLALVSLARK
ncbi:MAG: AAA family ATPase [Leptospiraceae bacterium]|nr:AAA family ATPase [Leptospiraceae bacterium]